MLQRRYQLSIAMSIGKIQRQKESGKLSSSGLARDKHFDSAGMFSTVA
jgi:hypothetical protein